MAKKKSSPKPQKQSSPKMPKKKSGKKGGIITVLLAAAATVIIGIVLLSLFGDKLPKSITDRTAKEVNIYFTDEEGTNLKAESHMIKKGSLEAEINESLSELIKGPADKDLANPLPDGTKLVGIEVKGDIAAVNFSPELVSKHPGGSSWEIQTVYSIVNTVILNFPEVKKVQILVAGKKQKTIAGHIDVSLPLGPDKKIIRN